MRANRWAKQGVLDCVFLALQENDVINIQVGHVSLDSTLVKVHPDGTGALKKRCSIYETRQLVMDLGMEPVVPPKSNRLTPWEYDREMYKKRNEVERLFRRLKGFRRIFSRFDKLDVVFTFFIHFALIVDTLFSVNRP